MKRLIASCDLYGRSPNFLYDGRQSCRTFCGGGISILVFACQLLGVAFVVWRFFERASAETNINKIYVPDPEGFVLDKTTLPFAFSVQDSDSKRFIDREVYSAEVWYEVRTNKVVDGVLQSTFTKHPLETVACSELQLDPQYFRNLPLEDMHCIRELAHPEVQLRITGAWESSVFGALQILIKKCAGPGCKSAAEIEAKLKRGFFAINYLNYAIQSTNYRQPVSKYPISYFTPISINFSKEVQFWLADTEIRTDDSIFGYVEPKSLKYTSVDSIVNELTGVTDLQGREPDHMLKLSFRMDSIKYSVSRVYLNLVQSLAELGGILKIIATASLLITVRLSSVLLKLDLAALKLRSEAGPHNPLLNCKGTRAKTRLIPENPSAKPDQPARKREGSRTPQIAQFREGNLIFPAGYLKKKKLSPDVDAEEKSNRLLSSGRQHLAGDSTPKSGLQKNRDTMQTGLPPAEPSLLRRVQFLIDRSQESRRRIAEEADELESALNSVSAGQVFLESYLPFLLSPDSPLKRILRHTNGILAALDYTKYLDLCEEVEKLKAVLFTFDQRFIFDCLKSRDICKSRPGERSRRVSTFLPREETDPRSRKNGEQAPRLGNSASPWLQNSAISKALADHERDRRLKEQVLSITKKEKPDEFDLLCIEVFGFLLTDQTR